MLEKLSRYIMEKLSTFSMNIVGIKYVTTLFEVNQACWRGKQILSPKRAVSMEIHAKIISVNINLSFG